MTKTSLYVITGTSGTGKTMLLEALKQRNHLCFDEPVRQLLQDQLATDGPALPAKNPQLFVQTLQLHFQRDYLQAQASGLTAFFDRGWPDSLAYAERFNLDVRAFDVDASKWRYHKTVFVTPPWREIFRNDPERKGSFELYLDFHERLTRVYRQLDYQLCELPCVSISERVAFIEGYLSKKR